MCLGLGSLPKGLIVLFSAEFKRFFWGCSTMVYLFWEFKRCSFGAFYRFFGGEFKRFFGGSFQRDVGEFGVNLLGFTI